MISKIILIISYNEELVHYSVVILKLFETNYSTCEYFDVFTVITDMVRKKSLFYYAFLGSSCIKYCSQTSKKTKKNYCC